MKTVDISSEAISTVDLFEMARKDPLLVKTDRGDSFIVTRANDEFAAEVELLRRNDAFLEMLDEFKKDATAISLEEVERRLR